MEKPKGNLLGLLLMTVIAMVLGAALALFSPRAGAAELGRIQNKAGGEIVFTDIVREGSDGALLVYSRAADGTVLRGEWVPMERVVLVKWDDGRLSMFEYSLVTSETTAAAPEYRL